MSSKSHTVQQQTVTPTNPTWVEDPVKGLSGDIAKLSDVDPQSLVAGADPLTTQAGASAGALSTSPNYAQASSIFGDVGSDTSAPRSLLTDLQKYMNPYTDNVVNTTLKGYDQNSDLTRSQQMLDLGNDTTFGGSGGSILRALTEGQLASGRASTEAGLRKDAFDTGANLSLADLQQMNQAKQAQTSARLAAAQGLTGTAATQSDDQRATINTQAQLGDILRQIQSQKQLAPINLLATREGLTSGLPLDLFHGQNSTTTTDKTSSNPLGAIGSLALGLGGLLAAPLTGGLSLGGILGSAGAAGSLGASAATGTLGTMMSDIRLKRDIVKLGERPDGLGVYLYRYLWSPVRFIGVMAQEVLKIRPEAVAMMPDGFYAVNYGAL